MPILKSIGRNFLEFFVVSFIVLTIVYFLINSIPGSNAMTSGLSDAQKQAIETKYGLNDPLIQRYFNYLNRLFLHGDLGISMSFRPGVEINHFLWRRFFISFTVGIISFLITIFVGIPLGVIVGRSTSKAMDAISSVLISIIISIPSVIFALFFLLIGKYTGIPYIYDKSEWLSYLLPALALSMLPTVVYVRYIRTEMNNEINSMHAKFAYLKGVSRTKFVFKHALKPALFPIITFLPGAFLSTFLGSLFIEKFFQIPGAGGLLIEAIQTHDYNVILIIVLIFSMITVLSYNIRDILYPIFDPRMRRA